MLTVKYISANGDEMIFEALRISTKKNPMGGKQPTEVTVIGSDGRLDVFTSGTVFVMNDTGATVSRWLIISEEKSKSTLGMSDHHIFGSKTFMPGH